MNHNKLREMNRAKRKQITFIWQYFIILFLAVLPFWVLGSVTHIEGLPFNMQLNVLAIFALPLVTIWTIVRTHGRHAIKKALSACVPSRTNPLNISIAFLTMPLIAAFAALFTLQTTAFDGFSVSIGALALSFVAYYIGAAAEEIGWTWLATPVITKRYGVTMGGLIIGAVWALIHVWPWVQVNGLQFAAGMVALTILNRLIMTWLYTKRGQLLWLNIAYHAMINTTFTIFHHHSPFADPTSYAVMLGAVTLFTSMVVVCFARIKK